MRGGREGTRPDSGAAPATAGLASVEHGRVAVSTALAIAAAVTAAGFAFAGSRPR